MFKGQAGRSFMVADGFASAGVNGSLGTDDYLVSIVNLLGLA